MKFKEKMFGGFVFITVQAPPNEFGRYKKK